MLANICSWLLRIFLVSAPDGLLLLCLDCATTNQVMREVHAGVCGPHMGGHMLARKIMRNLNAGTRKDHFPLPFVDQMLERVVGHEFYCFLNGY